MRWWVVSGGERVGEASVQQATIVYELHAAGRGTITLAGLPVPISEVERIEGGDEIGSPDHLLFVSQGRGSGDDVGDAVTVTVEDGMGRLAQALAWPDTAGTWSAQAEDVYTGRASGAILHYIGANVGDAALPARRYGYEWLQLPADPNLGETIEARARFDNLLTLLADIAVWGGVVFGFDGAALVIREAVAQPRELSESLGTASKVSWSYAAPKATSVVAGGAGEGTARVIVQVQSSAAIAVHGWREVFLNDARFSNVESLTERARAALGARRGGWAADVTLVDATLPGLRYGVDWRLGDTFPVRLPDGVHTMMAKGVVLKYDKSGGVRVSVSLVESRGQNSPAWLSNDGLALDRRVRLLETR